MKNSSELIIGHWFLLKQTTIYKSLVNFEMPPWVKALQSQIDWFIFIHAHSQVPFFLSCSHGNAQGSLFDQVEWSSLFQTSLQIFSIRNSLNCCLLWTTVTPSETCSLFLADCFVFPGDTRSKPPNISFNDWATFFTVNLLCRHARLSLTNCWPAGEGHDNWTNSTRPPEILTDTKRSLQDSRSLSEMHTLICLLWRLVKSGREFG